MFNVITKLGPTYHRRKMNEVVFLTFTRSYGRRPGLVRHGFIQLEEFKKFTCIPSSCIYVDVYQRDIRVYHNDKTAQDIHLDFWGFSGNLFEASRDMKDLEFPFVCNCVVNCVFSEYE